MTTLILVAFVTGAAGTWIARALAGRLGFVSHPNPIVPQHVQSVAYLGGVGIVIGLVAALAVGALTDAALPYGVAVGALGFVSLGTIDDGRPLRPLTKLAGQIVVAIIAIAASGHAETPTGYAAAVLWIVAIVNAVNLTDVCDGLVSGLAVVSLATAGCIAGQDGSFAWLVAAASAGFWLFNRAPATIFLGDGGSHLLGYAIAVSWLVSWQAEPTWNRALAALLGVGLFVLELGFLIVVRTRRGIAFWRGSPDHLALRLQAAGLTKQRTVAVALVAATVLGGVALWLGHRPSRIALTTAVIVALVLVRLVIALHAREPVPRAGRMREEERR